MKQLTTKQEQRVGVKGDFRTIHSIERVLGFESKLYLARQQEFFIEPATAAIEDKARHRKDSINNVIDSKYRQNGFVCTCHSSHVDSFTTANMSAHNSRK